MTTSSSLAALLESFFTDRMMRQRQASPHTIASYRDTFCLLLGFAKSELKKAPSALKLDNLDAPFVGAFLDHLEEKRGTSSRSRNTRLAAIRSFFKYAAFQCPEHGALIQRVLAMPSKRWDRSLIEFLDRKETKALLEAPNPGAWAGRRDRVLMLVAAQTGLRVSELIALRHEDVELGQGAHVRCRGKGRKERCTPLRKETVGALRCWRKEQKALPTDPLFPSARGRQLSRDGVRYILAKHAKAAQEECPSLTTKSVTPHVLRHTAAMDLLHHGVDSAVIALWLGHESVDTTQMYLHADMALKEKALARTDPLGVRGGRYKPGDRLLAFLKSL